MRNNIFFIDPQSMGNLAEYDYSVTQGMNCNIIYLCSKYYDYDINKKLTYLPIFSYNHKKNLLLKISSYLFSLICIAYYIIKHKPALIHIQWFKIPIVDYIFWKTLKKVYKVPIVHTAHNVLPHNTGNKYKIIYGKIYCNLTNKIIVHSSNTKEELIKLFSLPQDKIIVIRHGLLRMKYNGEKYEEISLYSPYNEIIKGKIVFTSLGEQSWYKGSDIIINAWKSTPELRQSDKCCLIIVGKFDGINYTELKNIKNVIVKNERISNEEYMYWLIHTDTYLLPYRKISQSGALLTVLAAHIPVIVTNEGGISEPLSIANVGWNIHTCNVENLRKILLEIVNNPNKAKNVKTDIKSWNKIEKFYDWQHISHDTENLYYQTIQENSI